MQRVLDSLMTMINVKTLTRWLDNTQQTKHIESTPNVKYIMIRHVPCSLHGAACFLRVITHRFHNSLNASSPVTNHNSSRTFGRVSNTNKTRCRPAICLLKNSLFQQRSDQIRECLVWLVSTTLSSLSRVTSLKLCDNRARLAAAGGVYSSSNALSPFSLFSHSIVLCQYYVEKITWWCAAATVILFWTVTQI